MVFIEKASQIKEAETLNAWCRHLSILQKLALFGDHQQLRATVKSYFVSEFGPTAQTSLMYRQIQIGHPFTMLTEQHRMHPHIAELVNRLIYNNRLTTNACAANRPKQSSFKTGRVVTATPVADRRCSARYRDSQSFIKKWMDTPR